MNRTSFTDFKISDEILHALDSLGYDQPTEVQSKMIPLALENTDHFLSHKGQNNKGPIVLDKMKNTTIKGKQLKVYEARR
ncbi:MAG TPA: DEAD/DEAH box helicase [Bacilli bacterium]|nr:DEAD/DEAH box helicase [Bacilli bacterium]